MNCIRRWIVFALALPALAAASTAAVAVAGPPGPAATPTPAITRAEITAAISGTAKTALDDLFTHKQHFTFKLASSAQRAGIGGDNPFVALFPELRRAPAPTWLKEGTRVTYLTESATIVQDPEDKGSSGAGYAQYDVVAMDKTAALSTVKLYIDTGRNTLLPTTILPSYGLPGAGDYWINPSVLEDAEKVADDNLTVGRLPLKLDGKTYQTVRFQYQKDDVTYVWQFDQATGLMLFYRHDIGGENAARRQLASATFVRRRQVKIPWQHGSTPDWVKTGGQLKYEGAYNVLIPGSPDTPLAYQTVARIKKAGANWMQYSLTATTAGRADVPVERITGAAQIFDGLWLPPQALAAMDDGVTLDRDPVTGAEISASRSADGKLVLTETGSEYQINLAYDEDGALVALERVETGGVATIHITLELTARK